MATQLKPAALIDTDGNHCWECGCYTPPFQRRCTARRYGAIICASCEPWVRRMLRNRIVAGGK